LQKIESQHPEPCPSEQGQLSHGAVADELVAVCSDTSPTSIEATWARIVVGKARYMTIRIVAIVWLHEKGMFIGCSKYTWRISYEIRQEMSTATVPKFVPSRIELSGRRTQYVTTGARQKFF
jgi:hypothetical protein